MNYDLLRLTSSGRVVPDCIWLPVALRLASNMTDLCVCKYVETGQKMMQSYVALPEA